ncbi:thioredoxin domain-containing protein [Corallococcus sp. M34]|uniref:vitamin K epoxide reductase/DsbA family protein n=1 Tax=Citreicoccus inhibens TaxID=2849499 RepID=UPI001C247980|nr:thioredoxin domain-containing protein [Citreicoccus inhibens]MBU8895419.1 thioredoxin domain-containing protein [Citreicoccus inhibens]
MSQKAPAKAPPTPSVPTRGASLLLLLGVAECVLSLFQWTQLLTLREGGSTVCGISEHVNCETVWNSPFASRVHELLGMPVAGLGLVWGLVAVGLASLYLVWARAGRDVRPAAVGLRLVAAAGVVSVVTFAAASAQVGALCLTCLGTYVLVLAFVAVAWRGLPAPVMPRAGELAPALKWTVGMAVAAFIVTLLPGSATPKASEPGVILPPTTASSSESGSSAAATTPLTLDLLLGSLTVEQRQGLSDALAQYRAATPQPFSTPPRRLYGPADAPVKIVEWTDSKCPHCKALVEELAVLKKRVPAGSVSVEARQFPLDGMCNPAMPRRGPDAPSVRCQAAKAQVCLESAPDFWELREKLFNAQAMLDTDNVVQIASSGSMSRMQLDACMASPETLGKLRSDVEAAMKFNLEGTPLVVVNGRVVPPAPALLYALVLAGGNANAPEFQVLPPPRVFMSGEPSGHEGHGH